MDLSERAIGNLGVRRVSLPYDAILLNDQRNIIKSFLVAANRHLRLRDLSVFPDDLPATMQVEVEGTMEGLAGADASDLAVRPLHDHLVSPGERVELIGLLVGATLPSPGDIDRIDVQPLGAVLDAGRTNLTGVFLENVGTSSATLTRLAVEWTDAARRINRVQIGSVTVWGVAPAVGTPTGTQPSGTTLDIVDTTFAPGDRRELTLRWDGGLAEGVRISCTFVASDGSSKKVTLFGPAAAGTTRVRGELFYREYEGRQG